MDTSYEPPREYLPVHPELKVYPIQEFYSVPKPYLDFLEQDMQIYGDFVRTLRSIHCESAELNSMLLRMESRVDSTWNRYLNHIREGAAETRILQLRECNRKTWYAASLLCVFLTSSRTLSQPVFLRRMEFILEDMDDLANPIQGTSSIPFGDWHLRFIVKIHKII